MVYVAVLMVVMIAFASLAIDVGRAELAKTQLQTAADSAALYGITGLTQANSVSTARTRAISAAADTQIDGNAVALLSSDIEFGTWDPRVKLFTPLPSGSETSATAMRVTAHLSASRGTALSTPFTRILGRSDVDIQAVAIACIGDSVSMTIDAIDCPWLAGVAAGGKVSDYTYHRTMYAPQYSPAEVTGIPVVPGQTIYFRDNSGTTGDTSTGNTYGLDGDLTRTTIAQAAANHINTTTAPLNALMGIFLNNKDPRYNSQPSNQPNFSSSSSRDFTTLSPGIQQVFFIGDGMNSSKVLQGFVVPPGATRLYLGVQDETAFWSDNVGSLNSVVFTGQPTLVK